MTHPRVYVIGEWAELKMSFHRIQKATDSFLKIVRERDRETLQL